MRVLDSYHRGSHDKGHTWRIVEPFHGKSFSWGGLTISQNCAIIPTHHAVHNRMRNIVIDFSLSTWTSVCPVESEELWLHIRILQVAHLIVRHSRGHWFASKRAISNHTKHLQCDISDIDDFRALIFTEQKWPHLSRQWNLWVVFPITVSISGSYASSSWIFSIS